MSQHRIRFAAVGHQSTSSPVAFRILFGAGPGVLAAGLFFTTALTFFFASPLFFGASTAIAVGSSLSCGGGGPPSLSAESAHLQQLRVPHRHMFLHRFRRVVHTYGECKTHGAGASCRPLASTLRGRQLEARLVVGGHKRNGPRRRIHDIEVANRHEGSQRHEQQRPGLGQLPRPGAP